MLGTHHHGKILRWPHLALAGNFLRMQFLANAISCHGYWCRRNQGSKSMTILNPGPRFPKHLFLPARLQICSLKTVFSDAAGNVCGGGASTHCRQRRSQNCETNPRCRRGRKTDKGMGRDLSLKQGRKSGFRNGFIRNGTSHGNSRAGTGLAKAETFQPTCSRAIRRQWKKRRVAAQRERAKAESAPGVPNVHLKQPLPRPPLRQF